MSAWHVMWLSWLKNFHTLIYHSHTWWGIVLDLGMSVLCDIYVDSQLIYVHYWFPPKLYLKRVPVVQWSRKLFVTCRTKCPAGLQCSASAGHFEPLSDIFHSWWLVNISGHSCFSCRIFYVSKPAGQNVRQGLSSLPDISRSLPDMSGIFRNHWISLVQWSYFILQVVRVCQLNH